MPARKKMETIKLANPGGLSPYRTFFTKKNNAIIIDRNETLIPRMVMTRSGT
jgi:hypothetical protein